VLTVAIAGGSLGGLCAGIALRGIGCDVDIFEQTAGALTSRGAGIVVQGEVVSLLRAHHAPPLPITSCSHRRYLDADTGGVRDVPMAQQFTSWESLYTTMKAVFPATRYHTGCAMSAWEDTPDAVSAEVVGYGTVRAEVLVCADGSRSASRRRLLPAVSARYAGYVAWRGTLDEAQAPDRLARFFDDCFTFCEARSQGHALCYFIPGEGATVARGTRRLNWVWYVTVPEGADLDRLLTDRDGRRRDTSVTPGAMPLDRVRELSETAARELHPRFADLIQATPDPFLQAIVDVRVPRMAFGRACLLGDAAFVVRPHTAAATAKAAVDATALADALRRDPGDVPAALRSWERSQLPYGQDLTNYGVSLGGRSVRGQ